MSCKGSEGFRLSTQEPNAKNVERGSWKCTSSSMTVVNAMFSYVGLVSFFRRRSSRKRWGCFHINPALWLSSHQIEDPAGLVTQEKWNLIAKDVWLVAKVLDSRRHTFNLGDARNMILTSALVVFCTTVSSIWVHWQPFTIRFMFRAQQSG